MKALTIPIAVLSSEGVKGLSAPAHRLMVFAAGEMVTLETTSVPAPRLPLLGGKSWRTLGRELVDCGVATLAPDGSLSLPWVIEAHNYSAVEEKRIAARNRQRRRRARKAVTRDSRSVTPKKSRVTRDKRGSNNLAVTRDTVDVTLGDPIGMDHRESPREAGLVLLKPKRVPASKKKTSLTPLNPPYPLHGAVTRDSPLSPQQAAVGSLRTLFLERQVDPPPPAVLVQLEKLGNGKTFERLSRLNPEQLGKGTGYLRRVAEGKPPLDIPGADESRVRAFRDRS